MSNKKFTIITEGGTKIEMESGTAIIVEIDGMDYEIEIKEK